MELSPRLRNLISRGTAFTLGMVLAYLAVGSFQWARRIQTDPMTHQQQTSSRVRPRSGPVLLPYLMMAGLGAGALVLVGFAVAPTRWLYSIDPRPSDIDGNDFNPHGGSL